MAMHRVRSLVVIVVTLLVTTAVAFGQLGAPFSGTLEPVSEADEAAGTGFLYSVLDYYPEGPKLMVNGTFEGMTSAATVAHLHRATLGPDDPNGPTPGPKVFDLVVSPDTNGTLNGSFWVSEEQVEDLKAGWYYVQVHSQGNPAGALRGWLIQGFLHTPEDSP